jgi:predicted acetyltransferase
VLELATPRDAPVLERLWQLYLHDLSEFRDSHPNEDGLFKREKLEPFLVEDPDRAAYLFRRDGRPVGFALVSGLRDETHWVDQFFVVRSARASGVGRAAAAEVLRRHPGRWRIGFQNENPKAARFWRRLAAEHGSDVREERQPVPGKPHIPDDVILSLTVS